MGYDGGLTISTVKFFPMVLLLFSGLVGTTPAGYSQATESRHECSALLEMDATLYPGSPDQTVDKVTVCEGGRMFASHVFTAPAFGGPPTGPTQWEYTGQLDTNSMADLRKVLSGSDISQLPEHVDVNGKKPGHMLVYRLRMLHDRNGKEQTVTLHNVPSLACNEVTPELTPTQHDLVCLFSELYGRAKSGEAPADASCGCATLHAMAARK